MLKKYLTNIKIVCLYTVALFSMNAYASFGGGYLCGSGNLACDFVVISVGFGLLRGGIPISILIFLGLHICLCNRERSKKNQAWLGALNSIIAFGVASFGAALMACGAKQHRNRFYVRVRIRAVRDYFHTLCALKPSFVETEH